MSRPASEPLPTLSPPFDLLLRVLSTPPSPPSFDPIQTALHLSHRHRLYPLLPSFLHQLARPLLLLHPHPLQTRSHLFVLPLYVQRSILSFLSASAPLLHPPPLLSLLNLYSVECSRHLQQVLVTGEKGDAHDLLICEYRLLLLYIERLYQQLDEPLPAALKQEDVECDRLMLHLRSHATFTFHSRLPPTSAQASTEAAAADDAPPCPSPTFAASPSPSPSPFAALIRRMCEREGLGADAIAEPQPEAADPQPWPAPLAFHTDATSAVVVVDFDDGVFRLPDEEAAASESAMEVTDEVKGDTAMEGLQVSEAAVDEDEPLMVTPPPAEVQPEPPQKPDEAAKEMAPTIVQAAMSAMQSLLTAVLDLQFSVADLQGPLTGQLTDEQLRAHPLLAGVIPHVDALHAMSTDAFAAAFSPQSSEFSLSPSSLSPWLTYLLVRLLLTPSVHHNRACLIVTHCIANAIDGEIHREMLLTITHAMSTHPAAVFTSLLTPPLTSPRLLSLSSAHFGLLRHCLSLSTRTDLTLALLSHLCASLTTNASSHPSSTLSSLPSHWSLEVLHLLIDALPSSEGRGAGEVAGMLKVVGGRGELGAVDATAQKAYAKVVRALVVKWGAECRRSRSELLSVCEPMKHFAVKKVVDMLKAL